MSLSARIPGTASTTAGSPSLANRPLVWVSALWGVSILLSRVIGLFREAVLGRVLGVGSEADVYFVAFTLPDVVNYLVAGGALTIVFAPLYGRHLAQGDEDRAWECYSHVANFHLAALGPLVLAVWLAAPTLVGLAAPGFTGAQAERLVHLTRIILPAQIFHILGGLLSAALQTRDRHSLPALSPLVYTLGVIAGGLVGRSAEGFAWGVLAGSIAGPFALNLAGAVAHGLRWKPVLSLSHPDLVSYLRRALPIMVALSIVAVDDWILRRVGSSLGSGAVTTLAYAKQLMKVPLGILGTAVGIASYPVLIRLFATGDGEGARRLLSRGIRQVVFLSLGAQILLTAAGPEISRLVYGGRISPPQHAQIGVALAVFCLGLWAWTAQNLLARGFYAAGNTWLPSLAGTAVTLLAYPVYVLAGRHLGLPGLAAASSAAVIVYVAVLVALRRRGPAGESLFGTVPVVPLGISLLAGLGAGLAVRFLLGPSAPFPSRLLLPPLAAGLAYLGCALALGLAEARELRGMLGRPFRGPAAAGDAPRDEGRPAGEGGGPDRTRPLPLVLTGGGTGGHVYPVLAIGRILERAFFVPHRLYVGVRGKAEEAILPRSGIPFLAVRSSPFCDISARSLLPAISSLLLGTVQSVAILVRHRPRLVVASGGYAGAPLCLAAFLLRPFFRISVVLHEQNVIPGLMNKVASLAADAVMVSHRESAWFLWSSRCIHTGYPVREDVLHPPSRASAREDLGLPGEGLVLLAYGGSMGSRTINRALPGLLPTLADFPRVTVIHAVGLGTGSYDAWEDTLPLVEAAMGPGAACVPLEGGGVEFRTDGLSYRLHPYLHRLPAALAAADLVLCRAGAGTLSEIASAGRAAVVIPKRGLPGDHQEHNAIHMARRGGCVAVFEHREPGGTDEIRMEDLARSVLPLLRSGEKRRALEEGARNCALPDVEARIQDTVRRVLEGSPLHLISDLEEPTAVAIHKGADALCEFLVAQPPGSPFRHLYRIKMEEMLRSPDWRVRNNGVKLAGALGAAERLEDLEKLFWTGNGYIRRNVLRSTERVGVFHEGIPGLLRSALDDPYFEVRAAAFSLAGLHADRLQADDDLIRRMVGAFTRPWQHLEVKIEALRVLPLFLPSGRYRELAGRYRFAENVRLRQSILLGLRLHVLRHRPDPAQVEEIRRFVDEMLITTSDFSPQFKVREYYRNLQETLDGREETTP
jgi:putative peptidoglycan lipid II flippase